MMVLELEMESDMPMACNPLTMFNKTERITLTFSKAQTMRKATDLHRFL